MKSLIVFSSRHHGNTERLVKSLAEAYPIDLLDADRESPVSLEDYDLIGFASGIDFGKFYPPVSALADTLPSGKPVYALFTCARDNGKYGNEIEAATVRRNCAYLGKFGCRGYNTYGPWKLIGGMNRHHPSEEDLFAVKNFYQNLLERLQNS